MQSKPRVTQQGYLTLMEWGLLDICECSQHMDAEQAWALPPFPLDLFSVETCRTQSCSETSHFSFICKIEAKHTCPMEITGNTAPDPDTAHAWWNWTFYHTL